MVSGTKKICIRLKVIVNDQPRSQGLFRSLPKSPWERGCVNNQQHFIPYTCNTDPISELIFQKVATNWKDLLLAVTYPSPDTYRWIDCCLCYLRKHWTVKGCLVLIFYPTSVLMLLTRDPTGFWVPDCFLGPPFSGHV